MRKTDRAPMSEAERARRLHQAYELLLSVGRAKGIIADGAEHPGRDTAPSAGDAPTSEPDAHGEGTSR
jgi:hypothetical protein